LAILARRAAVVLRIAGTPDPPLRLLLGNDASAALRRADEFGAEKSERWAYLARSTDFGGLEVSGVNHAFLKLNSA
jgi:hypothetical protein